MSALPMSMPLPQSFRLRFGKLRQDRKFLWFTLTSLLADAVGYTVVFLLNHHGIGPTRSNAYVSYSMAPTGLALNTWALTGYWRPSLNQTFTWFTYWLPSSARNTFYNAWLVGTFGFTGIQARLAVGLTFFLVDYFVKRFIIFGKCGELARFYFTRVWIWFYCRELLKVEMA